MKEEGLKFLKNVTKKCRSNTKPKNKKEFKLYHAKYDKCFTKHKKRSSYHKKLTRRKKCSIYQKKIKRILKQGKRKLTKPKGKLN